MPHDFKCCRVPRGGSLVIGLLLSGLLHGAYLENGIDPGNLGKGDWVYYLSSATNRLGGNVPSVVNVPTLMNFYKSQKFQFIVVKAGDGDDLFPSVTSPQFTASLVTQAHAAGLKIFGYTRSYGTNIPGEIAMAAYVYDLGADGFVIDAEAEWESGRLGTNGPSRALQLGQGIKAQFPNKFLAHAPLPIISYHSSFPYREFGLYCDAVMPQDYWKSIEVSPAYMVSWRDQEWRTWQQSLTGLYTNAIKPLAPVGQGWSPAVTSIVTGLEITAYVNALKAATNPATVDGCQGVSFWRTDLHTADMWQAISNTVIGDRTPPVLTNVAVTPGGNGAIATWNSQVAGDSQVEYGLTTNCIWRSGVYTQVVINHEVPITGLQNANRYYFNVVTRLGTNVYRSGPWSFFTAGEVIQENYEADLVGGWSAGTSSADKHGTNYLYAGTETNLTASAYFFPLLNVPGKYDVFIWYPDGSNRTTNAAVKVSYSGGSYTTRLNQQTNGGAWIRVGTNLSFGSGTNGYVRIGNNTGETNRVVMADAVRFLYRSDQDSPTNQTVPEWWSQYYFGTNGNATLDHDGDGFPDWMEYLAGTSPTDRNDLLQTRIGTWSGNQLQFLISPLVSNRQYRIQRVAGLTNTWSAPATVPVIPGTNGQAWLILTNTIGSHQFYRLQIDWSP